MQSGSGVLDSLLIQLRDFNLSSEIRIDDPIIKAGGSHYEILRGVSSAQNADVAVRRLRVVLAKEPVFAKVRLRSVVLGVF